MQIYLFKKYVQLEVIRCLVTKKNIRISGIYEVVRFELW